ncbi:MAG TPA: 50S ribosomal protein L15, partial [Bdellovibrionales bacterium]|nr:50S ribosomal protein L15 [Bdellovibrionales bacterium]
MSLLSGLRPPKGGEKKDTKRRGRGIGSGWGGTAGKGHKGQRARTGGRVRRGFEGGQMPLHRRLPKFGFTNQFRTTYEVVNLDTLNRFEGTVTPESLHEAKAVGSGLVKVLGRGKLTKALTVRAHKFSESAKAAIE